jgi:hypothetical protein
MAKILAQMPRLNPAIAAAAVMLLLCTVVASADPVRCSSEQQACAAACAKLLDPRAMRVCATACARRKAACQRTGCWDNGTRSYCGLLRQ